MGKGKIRQITPLMVIGGRVLESAPNTYTEDEIRLPLNPQLRQVYVVTDIEIRTSPPEFIPAVNTDVAVHLSKVTNTVIGNFDSALVMAISLAEVLSVAAEAIYIPPVNNPRVSTGDITEDYLAILATDNMFLAIQGNNNVGIKVAACKVTGYMAEVDSDIFAALVVAERAT